MSYPYYFIHSWDEGVEYGSALLYSTPNLILRTNWSVKTLKCSTPCTLIIYCWKVIAASHQKEIDHKKSKFIRLTKVKIKCFALWNMFTFSNRFNFACEHVQLLSQHKTSCQNTVATRTADGVIFSKFERVGIECVTFLSAFFKDALFAQYICCERNKCMTTAQQILKLKSEVEVLFSAFHLLKD